MSWKTKCVRLAPELLGALSPYRTHPINRFGMYELRKGTWHRSTIRDVRDSQVGCSKVTIVSLDKLLLIYERILTPNLIAAISLWNTVYLERAILALRSNSRSTMLF